METGLTEQSHVNRLKGEALSQSTSESCKQIFNLYEGSFIFIFFSQRNINLQNLHVFLKITA